MVKPFAIGIDAVMTLKTDIAKGIDVGIGELSFQFPVTGFTGYFLKHLQALYVAINAGKGESILFNRMPFNRKAPFFPGEMFLLDNGQLRFETFVLRVTPLGAAPGVPC